MASCWIFFVNYTMMHGSTNIMMELIVAIRNFANAANNVAKLRLVH
jgi:hypothetical protein